MVLINVFFIFYLPSRVYMPITFYWLELVSAERNIQFQCLFRGIISMRSAFNLL